MNIQLWQDFKSKCLMKKNGVSIRIEGEHTKTQHIKTLAENVLFITRQMTSEFFFLRKKVFEKRLSQEISQSYKKAMMHYFPSQLIQY